MAEDKVFEWQIPPQASDDGRKLSWLQENQQQGESWLRSQRGFSDFRKALDTISGKCDSTDIAEYRSHINTNHLKRNIREIVGTCAKLRPLWGYNSDNTAFKEQADMMNKVTKAWYLEAFADLSIKEALQYAAATCKGWIRPVYRRDMAGTGRGDIKLMSYGAPCVLPTQLPSSGDFQQAYAVTILDEMPIYMAHGMFPKYQQQLRPTSSIYWYSNEIRQAAQGNLLKRLSGMFRPTASALTDLLVPVRYTYVIDLALNTTDHMIPMGEPGTSWYYEVPNVGGRIPLGNNTFREATENDARLYPYRRLLISSESCVMYDGPAFDWHGRVPIVGFTLDAWPWEPIGFSPVRDGYELQQGINELTRGMMDKFRAQNDMGLAYDINAVTPKEAKQYDPMQPRARVGFDGSSVQTPFQLPIPWEVLMVRPEQLAFVTALTDAMDQQHAIKDMMALAKARLSGDDVEKMMEANGPIIEDMSRSMEPPMRDLGDMVKYLILQYYTSPRVMQIVGADGMTPETFDFDPASLVPSHLPGEDAKSDSPTPKSQRARIFADNLRFFITPNSLHELTQMTMKLGLIQLKKSGVKIDSQTIADAWNIPAYGSIDGATVLEKYHNEQEDDLEFMARMAAIKGSLEEGDVGMAGASALAEAAGVTPPNKPQEGRPPTGQVAPRLVAKDGGLRSTIAESPK